MENTFNALDILVDNGLVKDLSLHADVFYRDGIAAVVTTLIICRRHVRPQKKRQNNNADKVFHSNHPFPEDSTNRVGIYRITESEKLKPESGHPRLLVFEAMGVLTLPKANERTKLERLCRYIARPAVSTKRLSLTRNGQLRYELNQK